MSTASLQGIILSLQKKKKTKTFSDLKNLSVPDATIRGKKVLLFHTEKSLTNIRHVFAEMKYTQTCTERLFSVQSFQPYLP